MEAKSLAQRLQTIDRRLLYLFLAILMIAPLFYRKHFLPTYVSEEAKGVYNAVEAVPADKVIVLAADYDPGTMGENQPQLEAVMRHIMKLGKKFIILAQLPVGPELAEAAADSLSKEFGRKYGEDWVNWGFLPGGLPMLEGLLRNFRTQVKKDIKGKPLDELPLMAGVKDIHDVGLWLDFTGTGIWSGYVQLIYGPYKVPVGVGCTAVVGPQLFPYLDSKQLTGQLFGMRGAAEYEELNHHYGKGDQAMPSISFAHFLIIFLIIVGNVGYFWSRRQTGAGRS